MSASSPPKRDTWGGSLAILASLLGLSVCVCLATGLTAFNRLPGQLDRYLPLTPGTASLYRATYQDDSQGFASANVVPASDAAIVRARLSGREAVEVRLTYTNWQGGGASHTRTDYYGRSGDELVLLAQKEDGKTTELDPPIRVWAPNFLSQAIDGETTIGNSTVTYRLQVEGRETVTLPGGQSAKALKVSSELRYQERVIDQSTTWYAPGLGIVRETEYDGDGKLLMQTDLINSTHLAATGLKLPADELLPPTPPAAAFFRENAARTGAHPDADLPADAFKIVYRLKLDHAFTASPTFAEGLLYLADQAGMVTALEPGQGAPRWQFGMGGALVAAPAVAGGIVYVGASDKTVVALEARNGLFLWRRQLRDNVATSPVVADGVLYIGGEDQTLYALDALTGEDRWTFTAGDRIVSSPAVQAGRVFFGGGDALLYALDAQTGRVLWRYAFDAPVEATPAVSADGIVYAVSTGAQLAAVRAASGKEVWSVERRFGFHAAPAVGETLVFVADQNGAVEAYDRHTGQAAWSWQGAYGDYFAGSPLLLGRRLIAVSNTGALHVLDADTGAPRQPDLNLGDGVSASPTWNGDTLFITTQNKEVFGLQAGPEVHSLQFKQAWQYAFSPEGNPEKAPQASLVWANDTLYAALYNGDLVAVDAASGRGETLAQFKETIQGTPTFQDNVLYVATRAGTVLAYDLSSQQTLWRSETGGDFRFGPAVDDDRVYAHSLGSDGKVYALDRRTGDTVWTVDALGGNSTPALANGLLYVSADALLALDPITGRQRWRSAPFSSVGSLAAFAGAIYACGTGPDNITIMAVDARTGKTLWQRKEDALFFASRPAYDPASGALYLGATTGWLYAYDAQTGEPRGRFQADEALRSDLQAADGVIYFTAYSGTLYAVEAATSRLLSNFKPGSAIDTSSAPLVLPDRVYAVNGLTLYALELKR
jgi:outer membrane protein assembly factor BamB